MKIGLEYSRLANVVTQQLFKETMVLNINRYCAKKRGRVLLYHKTDPLTLGFIDNYKHSNNWEIQQQIKIFNLLGYWVDVIDRGIKRFDLIKDKYDFYIGLGLDGSGRHFHEIAKRVPSAIKILYAATSSPKQRNKALQERYGAFQRRNNYVLPKYRFVHGINLKKVKAQTDHIFCVGNEVTRSTLADFHKPVYRLNLSTYPNLRLSYNAIRKKRKDCFLFFGGNGNILKGLDLLVEAFAKNTKLHLFVCTSLEKEFLSFYKQLIENSHNIHIVGFVGVSSNKFKLLTERCAYVILPSCSEGMATSVTTCMRRGLIPVITRQCGIDVEEIGFYIENPYEDIPSEISRLSEIQDTDLKKRIGEVYDRSHNFTQEAFTKTFYNAMLNVLISEGKM